MNDQIAGMDLSELSVTESPDISLFKTVSNHARKQAVLVTFQLIVSTICCLPLDTGMEGSTRAGQ